MDKLIMTPAPGERLLRFVGDRVRFSLRLPQGLPPGARALLRTNLGKAARLRQEIVATHAGKNPMSVAFWRDVPLLPEVTSNSFFVFVYSELAKLFTFLPLTP